MNKENRCKVLSCWACLKIFTIVFACLLSSNRLRAQDVPQIPKRLYVTFYYDETGNRTARQIIIAMSASNGEGDSLRQVRAVEDVVKVSDAMSADAEEPSGGEKKEFWKDKLGDLAIILYPNPVHESFNVIAQKIGGTEDEGRVEYCLYAQSGRLLQRGKIAIDENKMIDMGNYTAGVYLFVIKRREFSETWKIIKQ